MAWKVKKLKRNIRLNNPVLLEGLPGIGNIGKLTVDFLVDELDAEELIELSAFDMPNVVFVNEADIIEMPKIKIYYKKTPGKKKDLLFLVGDTQPTDNESSYSLSNSLIRLSKKLNVSEIITIGGIGLQKKVSRPKLYCTTYSKELLKKYRKSLDIKTDLYGIVGPIFGASGLLVGMAKEHKIPAAAILAETENNPLSLGVKGSKEIIKRLDKRLSLNLDMKKLNSEVKKIEKQIKDNIEEIFPVVKDKTDTTYIG